MRALPIGNQISKSKVFDGRSGNSEVLTRDTWSGEATRVSRGRNEVFPRRSSIEPRFLSIPEVPTPAETFWWKYVDLFQGAALFFLDIFPIFEASPEEKNIFEFFLQILKALDERSLKTPDLRSTLTFVVFKHEEMCKILHTFWQYIAKYCGPYWQYMTQCPLYCQYWHIGNILAYWQYFCQDSRI